jgi:hypothetical protein
MGKIICQRALDLPGFSSQLLWFAPNLIRSAWVARGLPFSVRGFR